MQRICIASVFLFLMGCTKDYDVTFLNTPLLKPSQRFDFELSEPFNVQVNHTIYSVPKGFITDLASVPRVMWACYSPNDTRTIRAAILHDYIYRFNVSVTRKQADDIFFHSLIKGGTPRCTAIKYYVGVRSFGWLFYRN